jgi:hypothetical protein
MELKYWIPWSRAIVARLPVHGLAGHEDRLNFHRPRRLAARWMGGPTPHQEPDRSPWDPADPMQTDNGGHGHADDTEKARSPERSASARPRHHG